MSKRVVVALAVALAVAQLAAAQCPGGMCPLQSSPGYYGAPNGYAGPSYGQGGLPFGGGGGPASYGVNAPYMPYAAGAGCTGGGGFVTLPQQLPPQVWTPPPSAYELQFLSPPVVFFRPAPPLYSAPPWPAPFEERRLLDLNLSLGRRRFGGY